MTHEEQWLLREKYSGEKTESFFDDCKKLRDGKPLAYLIGHTPFLNVTIHLDSHPLIPRPETEFWVHQAIEDLSVQKISPIRILDLCAGSGCIGIAALNALPYVHVDFVEREIRHHETIRKNVYLNNIDASRTSIHGGDLFSEVVGTYDTILANPPYIDREQNRTSDTVTTHEPHEALFGGPLGFALIGSILAEAKKYLKETGILYVEHEPEQTTLIHTTASTQGLTGVTYYDQYGTERFTRLTRTESHSVAL